MEWWYVIPAAIIVLVWAGWYIAAFVKDKDRAEAVEHNSDRFAPQPDKNINHSSEDDPGQR